ncbi:hypothetical protein C8Q80DRAFT_1222381 [Daedaleopsis nitida]|nr:hypothetical protein C8Q80DRAFT_1222381 [Daedaleopsis nitida]
MSSSDHAKFDQEVQLLKLVLAKTQSLSFKIIHSTTRLLPVWKETCSKVGLLECLLPRDVCTQWNSTYDMLDIALKYRKAGDKICKEKQNKLRELELTPEEWGYVQQLQGVLKAATSFFSVNTPNLAKVIPAMDHLDQLLSTVSKATQKYDLPVCVSCGYTKNTLNCYYSYSNMSITYRIAMSTYHF